MIDAALITGATGGLGAAFADKLASEGYPLLLVSRNAEKLKRQADLLTQKHRVWVGVFACDLSLPGADHAVYNAAQAGGVQVQLLVNNAGFNESGCFLETDGGREQKMVYLHTVFVTEMIKLFLPPMIGRRAGRILNVGSTGSYIPCPYDAVYAATKAYILSVSKGIGAELKGTGVTMTALCPGAMRTEFAGKAGLQDTLLFKRFVMQPEKVADIGYKALMKGKRAVVAGLYNKMLVRCSRLLPTRLADFLSKKMLLTRV